MPKFVIEREMPGLGRLTAADLKSAAQKSNGVLEKIGGRIQWVHSYVTDDKMYCVYVAPSESSIREHARLGGFPANKVMPVRSMIEPITGD